LNALPASESFATGIRGETLALIVCRDFLWAGLLASPHSVTPREVAVATVRRAQVGGRDLLLGGERFPMTRHALKRASRWLDRQGVRVIEEQP
jgi:hypothetical protein